MRAWSHPALLLLALGALAALPAAAGPSAPEIAFSPALVPVTDHCAFSGPPLCDEPAHTTMTLTYTLGADMAIGGGIGVSLGNVLGGRYRRRMRFRWGNLQITRPGNAGYVTASTSRSDVAAQVMVVRDAERGTEALVMPDGALRIGDQIVVSLGATDGGGPGLRIPGMPLTVSVMVRENLTGPGGTFEYLDRKHDIPFPTVEVHGRSLDHFQLSLPSEAMLGQEVVLTIRAMAGTEGIESNTLIVRDHVGTLALASSDPEATLPAAVIFTAADRGVRRVPVAFHTRGATVVSVGANAGLSMAPSATSGGTSNPIMVGAWRVAPRTLWGILHVHSGRSRDGAGETENAFVSARDEAGLDFLAVSEHCNTVGYNHHELTSLVDTFDEPGRFTAFRAYEWSNLIEGHRHVIYPDAAHQDAPCEEILENTSGLLLAPTLQDLDAAAAAQGAITLVHHSLWRGRNAAFHSAFRFGDPAAEPPTQKLFEIYSTHGRSEFFDNTPYLMHGNAETQRPPSVASSFQDALGLGFHLGVTAGTDNHLSLADAGAGFGFNTSSVRYGRQGLTAVLAGEVSRAAIFEALERRRVYGTTGARIRLRFRGHSRPMGSSVRNAGPANLFIQVAGTAELTRIVVIRDGHHEIVRWEPDDASTLACLRVRDFSNRDVEHSYYVRVEQIDEHLAWSSPIWYAPAPGRRHGWPGAHSRPALAGRTSVQAVACPGV